jgi:hypothetical protein
MTKLKNKDEIVHRAKTRFVRCGGKVKPNRFIMHPRPGIKVLGYIDALVKFGGFKFVKF